MYWEQQPNHSWIDQIRYYCNHQNNLSVNQLRDAFIHLAYLYVTDFSNLKLIEDHLDENVIESIITCSKRGQELSAIDFNEGNTKDILEITLNLCDYIESQWFSDK